MGKDKKSNPADQFRKQQRKKELKRNKERSAQVRDVTLARQDPTQIQQQIDQLDSTELKTERGGSNDKQTQDKIQKLQDLHSQVLRKKREYAGPASMEDYENAMNVVVPKTAAELEREHLEQFPNPERSIYYHPTLNPFGAPPPGMPMQYRSSGSGSDMLLEGPSSKLLMLTNDAPPPLILMPPSLSSDSATKIEEDATKQIPVGKEEQLEEEDKDLDLSTVVLPLGIPPLECMPPKPKDPPPLRPPQPFIPSFRPPIPQMYNPMHFYAPPQQMYPPSMPPPTMVPPPPTMIPPPVMPPPPSMFPPPPAGFNPAIARPPGYPANVPPNVPPTPRTAADPLQTNNYQPKSQQELMKQMGMNVNNLSSTEDSSSEKAVVEDNFEESAVIVPSSLRIRRDNVSSKPKPKPATKQSQPANPPGNEAYNLFMKDMKDLGAV